MPACWNITLHRFRLLHIYQPLFVWRYLVLCYVMCIGCVKERGIGTCIKTVQSPEIIQRIKCDTNPVPVSHAADVEIYFASEYTFF